MPRRIEDPAPPPLEVGQLFDDEQHARFAWAARQEESEDLRAGIEAAARQFLHHARLERAAPPSAVEHELRDAASAAAKLAASLRALPADALFAARQAAFTVRDTRADLQGDDAWSPHTFDQGIDAIDRLAEALQVAGDRLAAEKGVGRVGPVSAVDGLFIDVLRAAGLPMAASYDPIEGEATGPQIELMVEVIDAIRKLRIPGLSVDDVRPVNPNAVRARIRRIRGRKP